MTRRPRHDSPLTRYAAATAPGGWLTADGWLRLAADLDARAAEWGIGECRDDLIDRAADCRARAAALTRNAI